MKRPDNLSDKMQNSFRRVFYYVFIVMAILAACTLHLNALTSTYWLEGKLFGERFNEGLWESCIRFRCTKILGNAQKVPGNFLIDLILLHY